MKTDLHNKLHRESRDLAKLIYKWHHEYLPTLRSCSPHTVKAYKQSLGLYATYLSEIHSVTPFTLKTDTFSVKMLENWRQWLKSTRKCCHDTCNQRMTAIYSLLQYIGSHDVQYAHLYLSVIDNIKPLQSNKNKVNGMSREAVKAIFSVPDPTTRIGLRDLVLMMLNYGIAARIDEVLSLKIKNLQLETNNPYATVFGKGGKYRSIYLQADLVRWLKKYINVYHGSTPRPDDFLFYSPYKGIRGKLTQPAVDKRLNIIAKAANEKCPDVPLNLHSHL